MIKNCAGCRALFKITNNGNPYVYCYLDNEMQDTEQGVLDKRIDFVVYKKPIVDCKVRTNKEMVFKHLNT